MIHFVISWSQIYCQTSKLLVQSIASGVISRVLLDSNFLSGIIRFIVYFSQRAGFVLKFLHRVPTKRPWPVRRNVRLLRIHPVPFFDWDAKSTFSLAMSKSVTPSSNTIKSYSNQQLFGGWCPR